MNVITCYSLLLMLLLFCPLFDLSKFQIYNSINRSFVTFAFQIYAAILVSIENIATCMELVWVDS